MSQVSNTTLAVLIIAALAISIIGTWLVLNKPVTTVSGISAAVVGNATFNVTSISSIKFYNSTFSIVNFGNINTTDCSPWFVTGTNATPPCYNNTEDDNPNPFVVENDGGNKVNVTLQTTGMDLFSTSSFMAFKVANQTCYHARNTPTGACNGQTVTSTGGARFPGEADSFFKALVGTNNTNAMNEWQNKTLNVGTNPTTILTITFLNSSDSNDTFVIDWSVYVAGDESAGMHNSTVTLTASDSGTGP
ncbi:MAG TPA: hypothetical protein VGQ00_02785 [Candidatus Norongarragalinales archaeon]|jgi:hypothetical protein|nr:hypothetical protein [Candidatus Norongarragalinales archaeon]